MRRHSICALILAAGYSSRMKAFKPLLPLGGKSVIERAAEVFREAGIGDVRAVVGHQAGDLLPVLQSLDVKPVLNEKYDCGMFSSVLCGVHSLAGEAEGFYLLPVDVPLVKSRTIRMLLEKYQETKASIIYPCFRGQRGHPPLISKKCFPGIRQRDLNDNLRNVLRNYEDEACDLDVIDQGVLLDMDNPSDYQRILSYPLDRSIPTVEECEALFSVYQPDPQVKKHGETVSKVALKLAASLNRRASCTLDLDLVRAASLLHDLAKGQSNHALAGAAILKQEGFEGVAGVVSRHMDLKVPDECLKIDAASIVYLADKLVEQDRVVTIEQRFAQAQKKFSGDSLVLTLVNKRLNQALLLKEKIEEALGGDLYAVVSGGRE